MRAGTLVPVVCTPYLAQHPTITQHKHVAQRAVLCCRRLPLSFADLTKLRWLDLSGNPWDAKFLPPHVASNPKSDTSDQEFRTCADRVRKHMQAMRAQVNKLAKEIEKQQQQQQQQQQQRSKQEQNGTAQQQQVQPKNQKQGQGRAKQPSNRCNCSCVHASLHVCVCVSSVHSRVAIFVGLCACMCVLCVQW